jgi:hypothetical protein
MKSLFATTAVLEFGTGLVLLAIPSAVAMLLLGAQLDTPVGLTVARLGGVALLAIGTACWIARPDSKTRVAKGLACAMLIYNVGAVAIFLYAGLGLQLSGIGLWPAAAVHAAMAAWCITCLLGGHP